jgi:NUMOD4 motif/HNH endonuclease
VSETEIWKDISGFEGIYQVSNLGRVRSLDRRIQYVYKNKFTGEQKDVSIFKKGRVLRPGPNDSGHLTVVLGRRHGSRQVHDLVLREFVGPPPDGHESLHGDGDPTNNRLSNLRWGTRSENLHDAVKHGAKKVAEEHRGAKLKNSDIPVIRSLFGSISYAEIGRRYSVSEATIRQIKDGKSWKSVA